MELKPIAEVPIGVKAKTGWSLMGAKGYKVETPQAVIEEEYIIALIVC